MELNCGNISRQLPQIGILVQYLFSIATKKDLLAMGKQCGDISRILHRIVVLLQ
jgi:hypothetical protein